MPPSELAVAPLQTLNSQEIRRRVSKIIGNAVSEGTLRVSDEQATEIPAIQQEHRWRWRGCRYGGQRIYGYVDCRLSRFACGAQG